MPTKNDDPVVLTKLTKDQFIPLLDVAEDKTFAANEWVRIDLSTICELAMNEEEEDVDYICYANPVTEIKSNKPELPQEIALYEGNPLYDFMIAHFQKLPIGDACKLPFLFLFGGSTAVAWRCIATVTSKVLNTPEGKLSFTIKMGGDIEVGGYTITDGKVEFVPVNKKKMSAADAIKEKDKMQANNAA